MDKLWAPWRFKYISGKIKGCIFCNSLKSSCKDYVVFRTKHAFCILNIFPYNNGHVMVSPRRHVKDMSDLSNDELLDLCKGISTAKDLLDKTLKPKGYNIGINIGRTAGAGIVGHMHIHIVPRWEGDTNFMPVVHNTKIISQSLNELHKRLKTAYAHTKRH